MNQRGEHLRELEGGKASRRGKGAEGERRRSRGGATGLTFGVQLLYLLQVQTAFPKKSFFWITNSLIDFLVGAFRWRFTPSIDLEPTIFLQSNYEYIYGL
jgi:hypothetical protein